MDHAIDRLRREQHRHGVALGEVATDLQEALDEFGDVQRPRAIGVDDLEEVGPVGGQIQVVHKVLHPLVLDHKQEELFRDRLKREKKT